MVTGDKGVRINWKIGMDIYTLLINAYIITKTYYKAQSSILYFIMTYMGKES